MNNITNIGPDDRFIEDLIWMSYRYCIGRHTIAASMHAPNIAAFIHLNPDLLSDQRKLFMAHDIRKNVSDVIHWKRNVYVMGDARDVDAYSLILKTIHDCDIDATQPLKYEVDMYKGTVNVEQYTGNDCMNILDDISDLSPWIRLANWLDPHMYIRAEYKDNKVEGDGFVWYAEARNDGGYLIKGKVEPRYTTCEQYIKSPFNAAFLDPTYIKEIKYK